VVGELDINLHGMGGVMGWGVGGVGGVEQLVTVLRRCPVG
jgi:hypothetical protein